MVLKVQVKVHQLLMLQDVWLCVAIIGKQWTCIRLTPDPHPLLLCVHDVTMNMSQEKQTQTVQKVTSTTGEANMVFD